MTAQRTLDVSGLPACDISSQAPLWWGQLALAAIEGAMFLMLIAMYFYTRLSVDMWPPPGDQMPAVLLPTIALAVLLLSCVPVYWASEAAKKDDRRGMVLGMSLNLLLAILFFAMRIYEWSRFNFNWAADIHGTYVWTMLGLHSLDIGSDMIFTFVLLVCVATGRYGEKQRLGVHVDGVLWYFLAAIWIPYYVVVYWGPRFVGAP